jgi:adenylosuccinate synthase
MGVSKIYVVTDLGPGDGGKGGVVHKVSGLSRAHTIVKVGGAQGSHGVATSSGDRFAFSQFGCGTFEGVRTHLSPRFVALPDAFLNEAAALQYDCGIRDVFDLLTVDEDVICGTPFHGIASRLKELARGGKPRGTIGTGVGETYRYAQSHPELTIRARDLTGPRLRDALAAQRERISADLAPIIEAGFLPEDQDRADAEIRLLADPGFLDYVERRFREAARLWKTVDAGHLERILARDGTVVVESSHGVLTDSCQGFHPHTSALRTLPQFTHRMLSAAGYDGEIVNLGVTRAYSIRHGAGPLPTSDPAMAETLMPGSHKEENRYQGKVRVGPLDLVLIRYAIAACGGPRAFDGIAVTWFDQIRANGAWHLAHRYQNALDGTYFASGREIRIRFGEDAAQFVHQEALCRALGRCVPEITTIAVPPDAERDWLFGLCAGVFKDALDVDVRMVSFGPTEREKLCK